MIPGARVTGSVSAVYVCRERSAANAAHVWLSPWIPDTARTEAKRLLGLVAGGKDPTRVTHGEGFGAVMERYLALREPAMKPRSFTGTARHLRQHAKPLQRLALADIDRRAIAERLGRLRRSHHRTLNGTDLGPPMSGGFASWENLTLAAIVGLWFGLWLVA